jgi:hypothetical protein
MGVGARRCGGNERFRQKPFYYPFYYIGSVCVSQVILRQGLGEPCICVCVHKVIIILPGVLVRDVHKNLLAKSKKRANKLRKVQAI